MNLSRQPLLLERARPSLTRKPKSRTRHVSSRRQLGKTRRSLESRLTRRTRDRLTPQKREVLRSTNSTRYRRQQRSKPLLRGGKSPRNRLLRTRTTL